jgi:hypothetical protein
MVAIYGGAICLTSIADLFGLSPVFPINSNILRAAISSASKNNPINSRRLDSRQKLSQGLFLPDYLLYVPRFRLYNQNTPPSSPPDLFVLAHFITYFAKMFSLQRLLPLSSSFWPSFRVDNRDNKQNLTYLCYSCTPRCTSW